MPRQAPQAGQVLRAVRNCRLGWALQAECCVIAVCTALTDHCRACLQLEGGFWTGERM